MAKLRTAKAFRSFALVLGLATLGSGQGCFGPLLGSRECGDNGGEPYRSSPFDEPQYHPCGRECRAGSETAYSCRCSRTCPCWDYH